MTEIVHVKVSDAITVLKCLRELLLATLYLHQHTQDHQERFATRLVYADQMAKYVHVLDLYLTDKSTNRNIEVERQKALRMLHGTEWEAKLSDDESVLVIRVPTLADLQSVKATFPDHPKNAKAYHRWQGIDVEASQPTEFGPPDENGNEIKA